MRPTPMPRFRLRDTLVTVALFGLAFGLIRASGVAGLLLGLLIATPGAIMTASFFDALRTDSHASGVERLGAGLILVLVWAVVGLSILIALRAISFTIRLMLSVLRAGRS